MSFLWKITLKSIRYFQSLLNRVNIRINPSKYQERLSVLPGIGMKNAQRFFDAGYKTPAQILKASDEALLQIPGVGKNFITRLRNY